MTGRRQEAAPEGHEVASRVTLRDQQKRFTRARLLEAASVVLAEKGYTAATIDDIVERAGASRGTYYLYFKTKAEIIETLIEEYTEQTHRLVDRLGQLRDPSSAEVRGWLDAFTSLYEEHRHTIRAWWQAIPGHAAMQAVNDANFMGLVGALARHLQRTGADTGAAPSVAEIEALLLVGQLERFCFLTLVRSWPLDRELGLDAIAHLWWTVIGGNGVANPVRAG